MCGLSFIKTKQFGKNIETATTKELLELLSQGIICELKTD